MACPSAGSSNSSATASSSPSPGRAVTARSRPPSSTASRSSRACQGRSRSCSTAVSTTTRLSAGCSPPTRRFPGTPIDGALRPPRHRGQPPRPGPGLLDYRAGERRPRRRATDGATAQPSARHAAGATGAAVPFACPVPDAGTAHRSRLVVAAQKPDLWVMLSTHAAETATATGVARAPASSRRVRTPRRRSPTCSRRAGRSRSSSSRRRPSRRSSSSGAPCASLESLKPTFVSVTYGAGGSTREGTVQMTGAIAEQTELNPVAHLTAVNHSVAELRNVIGCYASVGVRNVLALRGDPPGDPNAAWVPHPDGLAPRAAAGRAAQVLGRLLRRRGRVPRAAPALARRGDRHPALRREVPGGRRLRHHPDVLLRRGLPPAQGPGGGARLRRADHPGDHAGHQPPRPRALDRAQRLQGPGRPARPAPGGGRARRRGGGHASIGVDYAAGLCARLLDEEVPGLHFITLNASRATMEIYQLLGLGTGHRVRASGSGAPITA